MEHVLYTDWLLWILLYPLIGAAINGIFGSRLPKKLVTFIGLAAPAIALMWAIASFFPFVLMKEVVLKQTVFEWINAGGYHINFALMMDELSGIMAMTVTFVGFLIHIYSVGYMHDDPSYSRYFAYLNLFMFSMLTLVLADNLLVMFIGWEGVGLCSYLLIGFWFDDTEKAKAGLKAFVTNRIGDFGFLVAMFIFFNYVGSVNFEAMRNFFANGIPASMGVAATVAGLMLFLGATGKSAQIPLYVWLPDAMAGPTPVSALIHAATMVTAGVYMIARLNFFFVHVPVALAVVAFVGALTALFAATIGFFQNDIKKVLAYSTVSQLGYMFMGVGVGAWAAGVFHLFTHAFFKALLFLGSGSVIHAMSGIQDMRQMGGLKEKLPKTYWTFAIATFTIAGFPPAAAFFSKDEILWKAFITHNEVFPALPYIIWAMGLLAAFGTSFYMYRLLYMTFSGENRAPKEVQEHIHESPAVMTWPLIILAGFSLIVGFLGLPHVFGPNLFEEFLSRHAITAHVEAHGPEWLELTLMAVSVLAALGGWWIARVLYKDAKSDVPARLAEKYKTIYQIVYNKYYVDEGYFYFVIRPIRNFAIFLWQFIDAIIIDTILVRGLAWLWAELSLTSRRIQTGNVHVYIVVFVLGMAAVLLFLI